MKAIWKGQVIAESDDTLVVENNHYFPLSSIKKEFFTDSSYHTFCPWKGTASYRNVVVNGEENENTSWYYPDPKDAAKEIKDYVAFWRGVEVTE